MNIEEEAIRNTYKEMLKLHPENKKYLDIMLKIRLKSICKDKEQHYLLKMNGVLNCTSCGLELNRQEIK